MFSWRPQGLQPPPAVGHPLGDAVVHHLQAGVVPQDDLVRGQANHVAEDLPHLRQAVPNAVVPAVVAVGIGELAAGLQGLQHPQGQVQLIRAGLASGHIQLQVQGLKVLVPLCRILVDLPQLRCLHRRQFHHNISLYFGIFE